MLSESSKATKFRCSSESHRKIVSQHFYHYNEVSSPSFANVCFTCFVLQHFSGGTSNYLKHKCTLSIDLDDDDDDDDDFILVTAKHKHEICINYGQRCSHNSECFIILVIASFMNSVKWPPRQVKSQSAASSFLPKSTNFSLRSSCLPSMSRNGSSCIN